MGRMPERPVDTAFQKGSIPHPNADTTPMPVMATLTAGKQFLHAFGNVGHGTQRLCGLIGYVDAELVLDAKDDVDAVERVDLQLFEGALGGDAVGGNVLGLGDDTDHARQHVFCHNDLLYRSSSDTVRNW